MKFQRLALNIAICLVLLPAAASCSGPDAQPALKDAFKNDFLIGAALNDDVVNGKDPNAAAIVEKHFSAITAENVMKWPLIHPLPDKYNFDPADRFVEFGRKNKMFIIGHTLICHDYMPDWAFKDNNGNQLAREAMLSRMKEHIFAVVGRYKGKVNGWDVVNEALKNDGDFKKSKWFEIIGDDFVRKAFEYAHEADPNAELYYNDYSLEKPAKRDAVARLVKDLKSKGIRIDGVGLQGSTLDMNYPSGGDIEAFIDAISALGVKIMITEMCIDVLPKAAQYKNMDAAAGEKLQKELNPYVNGLPDEIQQKLADRYAELFSLFRRHAGKITRVTFWGVQDGQSFLNDWPVKGRMNYPLLFDRKYQPKPAFFAVIKTAETKP